MISKVSGYSGFSSYQQVPYPSLKAGQQSLAPTNIWENTRRERGSSSVYDNSAHHTRQSIYAVKTSDALKPVDFENHTHVRKGDNFTHSQYRSASTSTRTNLPNPSNPYLESGVEHWKTSYGSSIGNSTILSATQTQTQRAEWTYPRNAYLVDTKIGPSEYKSMYGELGSKPVDRFDATGFQVPDQHADILKMGTTKMTKHTPNYCGFIPTANTGGVAQQQAAGERPRLDKHAANIIQNLNHKIPGYAGHQPQAQCNKRGYMRERLLSTVSNLKV